jgi:L-erythro-3,5-diaminohexanoate dehydrogenase
LSRVAGAGDTERMAARIASIVAERGKMHNPVTGSGGVLSGSVRQVDPRHPDAGTLRTGDRLISLASLSLTPLQLDGMPTVTTGDASIGVRGYAIMFASAPYAHQPADLPAPVTLAVLDVAGAPALTAQLVRPGMRVAVLGAGKSGALCLAQARRGLAGRGLLLALDADEDLLRAVQRAGLCDQTACVDATRPVQVLNAVSRATGGELCDLVINCTTVPHVEGATVLSTRTGGTALFFSMATDFRAATLGAEGAGRDIRLLMGNGYTAGHAALALDLLRSEPALRQLFDTRFARRA